MSEGGIAVGRMFGRYRIDAVLGQGGMGQVFRAFDTVVHRPVALKVIRPRDLASDAGDDTAGRAIERLLREARAAAALSHPNVVAVYDIASHEGVHYLALELVEGRTLRAVSKDASVPMERRLAWLIDLARTLGAAHRAGLVHRDVKPENVMVRDDGTLKVLDFGLARAGAAPGPPNASDATAPVSPDSPALPTLTTEGMIVGTPLYMSPEQLFAHRVDGRADQWAWAVVAWELLSGAVPWSASETAVGVVARILAEDPGSLRAKVPALPEAWDRAITRALSKDREARFESMEVLLDALARPAESASTPVIAVAATHASTPASEPSREAPVVGAPPSFRRSRGGIVLAIAGVLVVLVAGSAFAIHHIASRRLDDPGRALASKPADASAPPRIDPPTAARVEATPSASAPPVAPSAIVEIDAGETTTCARRASGAVDCWGRNDSGLLGDGTVDARLAPVRVVGLDATKLAVGGVHACAIRRADRHVVCWGENRFGAAGPGADVDGATPITRPVEVPLEEPTTDLAAGRAHTCALGASGTVRCWGSNERVELGDRARGPFDARAAVVPGTSDAIAIDATAQTTCVLRRTQGTRVVTCWGNDSEGQVGDGAQMAEGRGPFDALRGDDVVELAVGTIDTCVRRESGAVDCWGAGCAGETGDPALVHPRTTAFRVPGLSATALDAGDSFACAIVEGGRVRCWGVNAQAASQLGAASDAQFSATPLEVRGVSGARAITTGLQHACALVADGSVSCWGNNGDGQLGHGTRTGSESAPVAVLGLPR